MRTRPSGTRGLVLLLAALVAVGGLAVPAGAQTLIKVPTQAPTIRAAFLTATPGTTIQVAPGTYQVNLIWPGVDGIRLVSEAGPGVTVLDAGRRGRVIKFGTGLTRVTVLDGFTLRGGFDSEGGGLYLGSSPTIRNNRIMDCVGEDVVQNRGGGIFVASGTSPLILNNTILGNVLDHGKTNEGAGVYVADNAFPDIVGNSILNNICRSPDQAFGGGISLGLTGTPSALVASNLVAANQAHGSIESRGAGIHVAGGTAVLINNTIADNQCTALAQAVGGGLFMGKTGAAGSRIHNNILVSNTVQASVRFGGGIYCDGTPPLLDYNDVWNNTGGDYFGCAPGPNDRSLDPLFQGIGDYRLSILSPCLDAGANVHVPGRLTVDAEGDPRRIDGNLDGLAGNGATVDRGADEVTGVRLLVNGPLAPGSRSTFRVTAPAGAAFSLFWSPYTGGVHVNPFGTVLLGYPFALVAQGATPASVPYTVPFVNALSGLDVHFQALVAQSLSGMTVGQLTNRLDLTLFKRFDRPIVENFYNRLQLDPNGTTAGWSLQGQAGLFSTSGYGGNAGDGTLSLLGTKVLDSSTRQPAADGTVEWNFGSLEIASTGRLVLTGNAPIRVNVAGNAEIWGTIDARGLNGQNAPAGTAAMVGRIPGGRGGPGAGAGGDANVNPTHPIGALPMELRGGPGYPKAMTCTDPNKSDNRLITVVEPNCGGGTGGNRGVPSGTLFRSGCSGNGGGHAQMGIQTDYLCSNIGAFGREFGTNWVVTSGSPTAVAAPTAGTGGGAGGNAAVTLSNPTPNNDIVAGSGGGGGGGVEILTAGQLVIYPGASILADGGHGGTGYSTVIGSSTVHGGYGGGGAGGSIWLSGTAVVVNAGAVLSAVGGTGNPNPSSPTRTGAGGDGYIIIRDLSGIPVVNANAITPPPAAGRGTFTPTVSGKSTAYSLWYGAGGLNPQWAFDSSNPTTGEVVPGNDLTFSNSPGTNQKVFIAFQAAPDLNGAPDPDPTHWHPPGNTTTNPKAFYENDISKLRGKNLYWIRFRVQFDLGPISTPLPPPVAISRLAINY